MIITDIKQRTPEWHAARAGALTASNVASVVTPTGKLSTSEKAIQIQGGIAAKMLGITEDEIGGYTSAEMERGIALEEDAISAVEFIANDTIARDTFITSDDGLLACSPDGISKSRGYEIKCPTIKVHIGYFLKNELPREYLPQVAYSMWLTGRDEWAFCSYHPAAPLFYKVSTRKACEAYISALDEHVPEIINGAKRIAQQLEAA